MADTVENLEVKEEETKQASEPEYVVVASSPTDEPIELPTDADTTLGISTLKSAFPGASGLKFKNPKTGASRALLIDATGTKFCAPAGGWEDKLFTVIYQTETTKRGISDPQNAKRKKMMDDSVSSGSEDGDGNLHSAQVAKLLRLNKDDQDVSSNDDRKEKSGRNEESCTDLLILGLPYKLDENELREHFEKFGTCELVQIKKMPSGESKGFGFVRMSTLDEQNAVLDATHTIGGRKCFVKFPMPKDNGLQDNRNEDVRLFVGHLNSKITPKRLREYFSAEVHKIDPRAKLTDAFIPNSGKNFGFINVNSTKVAKELLKKDNFVIDENSVTLSIAAPKNPAQQQQSQSYYGNYGMPPISVGPHHNDRRNVYEQQPYEHEYPSPWENQYGFNDAYEGRYETASPYPSNPQSLSTGLETLNLNMKPDAVMSEALKAFWHAARTQQNDDRRAVAPPSMYPANQQRPRNYPPRRGPPDAPTNSRWR